MMLDPSPQALLVFPPATPFITHPELGVPQLTASMRAHGELVRQVDLNATFTQRFLWRPDVLRALVADLSPGSQRWLADLPSHLSARWEALMNHVAEQTSAVNDEARQCIEQLVVSHLNTGESTLAPGHPFRGTPYSQTPRDTACTSLDPSVIAEALLQGHADARFAYLIDGHVVQVVLNEYLAPGGFKPSDVTAALGHPCALLDDFLDEFFDSMVTPDLLLLGLSIHGTHQLLPSLRIAARARRTASDVHVVLGGPWCAVAESLLRDHPEVLSGIDSVCTSEGDAVLPGLLWALRTGQEVCQVSGLLVRGADRLADTGRTFPMPLSDTPAPVFDGFDLSVHADTLKLPFRTTRGCYWGQCVFCSHMQPEAQRASTTTAPGLDPRVLERLVGFMHESVRQGVRAFSLADNATPPGHLRTIAERLLKENLKVQWQTMARFDPGFTPELCEVLARSGCRELAFGLETSSDKELRKIRKGTSQALALRCLEACSGAGIHTPVFILDYPLLEGGSLERTFEFCCEHHDVISRMTYQRFSLARNVPAFLDPNSLGIQILPAARDSLSVFDLPFEAPTWTTLAQFVELADSWNLRFLRLKAEAIVRNTPSESAPKPSPTVTEIELNTGTQCNCACRCCHSADPAAERCVPWERLEKSLETARASGASRLRIRGGEPTLHPDLFRLIAEARRRAFVSIRLQTNGLLCAYVAYARRLAEAGLTEAAVLILGPDSSTHDQLTRVPGSFDLLLRGVRNLKARGVAVEGDVVVTRENSPRLESVVERFASLGLDRLNFRLSHSSRQETAVSRAVARARTLGVSVSVVNLNDVGALTPCCNEVAPR